MPHTFTSGEFSYIVIVYQFCIYNGFTGNEYDNRFSNQTNHFNLQWMQHVLIMPRYLDNGLPALLKEVPLAYKTKVLPACRAFA